MKRVAAAVCAVILAVSSFSTAAQESPREVPEEPYMYVYVRATFADPPGTPKAGEPCRYDWQSPDYFWVTMPYQIIVRNENDTIISVTDVELVYVQPFEDETFFCIFEDQIPLPEASFYGVFINDAYLTTFTPETLPTEPGLFQIDIGKSPLD
jgi:hypothetical protein